ncbi:MAG: AbrB/MazE/SpoVT family DNA-binding domain-containing protein [Elusimicrobia bacterium]|nr:AbrB/MazE/SpoVT family DNA-binding domain-containing protein [Elusimicrobiota bacterium]
MGIVTISPKYQVVIPKEAREKTHLKKGQKMIVVVKSGIISFIPSRELSEFRGFAKGMDKQNIREKKDRV